MMNILIYTNYFSFPAFFNYSNYSVCFIVSLFFSLDITHKTTIYTILPTRGINNKRKYKNHFFSSISFCLRMQAKKQGISKRIVNNTVIIIDIARKTLLILILKNTGDKVTKKQQTISNKYTINQFIKNNENVLASIFPLKSK